MLKIIPKQIKKELQTFFPMELLLIQQITLVLATGIAAFTDWKKGLIFDWLTLPLIGLGLVLGILQQNWFGIAFGIGVFAFLYALYWLGKLGGGDVKLFTGIAWMLPFYQKQVFLLPVLFFAGLAAITFYSAYYLFKIRQKKIRIDWKKNKAGIIRGMLFALLFTVYLVVLARLNGISETVAAALWVPFMLASVFVALEQEIKKNFFVAWVKVKELEEDEAIALELTDPAIIEKTGLGIKGIIGKKEKQKLEELGIQQVPIYANAPRFGPFIFLGVLSALWFPEIISLFFLRI